MESCGISKAPPTFDRIPIAIRVAGFVSKAYEIFSNSSYSQFCGWGRDGKTIVIFDQQEFASKVLPNHFKHSNYSSFVRQLNMYDFHKTVANPDNCEFHHPCFLKDRADLLHLVKRKGSGTVAEKATTPLSSSRGRTSAPCTALALLKGG